MKPCEKRFPRRHLILKKFILEIMPTHASLLYNFVAYFQGAVVHLQPYLQGDVSPRHIIFLIDFAELVGISREYSTGKKVSSVCSFFGSCYLLLPIFVFCMKGK